MNPERLAAARAELNARGAAALERAGIASTASTPKDRVTVPTRPTIAKEAFRGLLRKVVDTACEDTEASPIAVAATYLGLLAGSIGRSAYQQVGDRAMHCRPFFAIAGDSAKSRKGTSEDAPRKIFEHVAQLLAADPILAPVRIHDGGLSSGEGIAWAIRDPSEEVGKDGLPTDPGVTDKRLVVIEGEFANVLSVCKRDSNTLSSVLRNLWDGRTIAPLTKRDRVRATNPHVVVIGHITAHELTARLDGIDMFNGFLNRFMVLAVHRPKLVPVPLPMPEGALRDLAHDTLNVIRFAQTAGRIDFDANAHAEWATRVYPALAIESGDPAQDALLARADIKCRLLAGLFALLDRRALISVDDLRCALLWVKHWRESVAWVLDSANRQRTDKRAERALAAIVDAGADGITGAQLHQVFDRNLSRGDITRVIEALTGGASPRVRCVVEPTAGRPVQRFIANEFNE